MFTLDWQTVAALMCVVFAAGYFVSRATQPVKKAKKCCGGGGGGCGCKTPRAEVPRETGTVKIVLERKPEYEAIDQ